MEDSNSYQLLIVISLATPFVTAIVTAIVTVAFTSGMFKAKLNGLKDKVDEICKEIPILHNRINDHQKDFHSK